jgi:hypothetical protein
MLEPAPFAPQRLGLDLLEAPKPPTARPGIVAAARALPAAGLLGAEAERSQQIALRAPDQIVAHARWARQPLFEREPPRKASRGSSPRHNLSFENALMSFCEMSFCDMRSFVVAMPLRTRALPTPRFAYAKKSQAKKRRQKHSQENASLKRREAERREAHHRAASKSDAARVLSPIPLVGGPRPRGPHGAGALAFRRPTAASEVFALGSAQAALPGITGCKREDPLRHQCSEHLAVRHVPDGTMPKPPASAVYRCARREPLPLRLKEYPRERRPSRAGFCLGNCNGDKCQGQCLFIRDRLVGAD